MPVANAFSWGLRQSLRLWRTWLPLYLANALIAFFLTLPFYSWLSERLSFRLWAERLLSLWPLDIGFFIDLFGASSAMQLENTTTTEPALQLLLPVLFGLPLQVIAYACFSGGYLEALRGENFWVGCRRWFGPFLGLALVMFILTTLLLLPALITLISALTGNLFLFGLGVAFASVAFVLTNGIGEIARISMVSDQQSNPLRAVGRSFRFIFSNLGRVLGLGTLLLVIMLLLGLTGVVSLLIPGNIVWLSIIWTQVRALLDVWYKALRLSSHMGLYAERPALQQSAESHPAVPTVVERA